MSLDPAALAAPHAAHSGAMPRRAAASLPGLLGWLQREAALLGLFAAYLGIVLSFLPYELVQDTWLTLVSGREVVANGLPRTDMLTTWTLGVEWIDQQWLAQVAFYALWLLGGMKAAVLAHAALLAVAFGSALLAARRLGASVKSVALVGVAAVLVAPWALQMRAQSFALPLFVWLLWLLAADSRAPSRRVFLVLPLLVVWANLHGTVVLAALLVALRGLTYGVAEARRAPRAAGWIPRTLALTLGPFGCLFASPYGLDLVGYYHSLLLNPVFRRFIDEWGASTPSPATMAFYLLAFGSVWLLARQRTRLTLFEQLALIASIAAGITALRSIVWFGLVALLFLPLLLDGELSEWKARPMGRQLRLGLGVAAVATIGLATGVAAAQPASWYSRAWPSEASEEVARLAADRAGTKIFSDDRYANWLLWTQPQLAGRVAHDIRFELLTEEQLFELFRFRNRIGDDWRSSIEGYDVLAFDHIAQRDLVEALQARDEFETVWRDEQLVVLARRLVPAGRDGARGR
jgi:hypothetical protein